MTVTSRYRRVGAAGLINAITAIVVTIIVVAIVMYLVGANHGNMLVGWFEDAGRWLTTPFHNLFTPHNVKQNILFNWGLAALVYAFLGGVIARVVP